MLVIHLSVLRITAPCLTLRNFRSCFTVEGETLPAKINPEETCVRAGGICLPEKECPTGHLNPERGLCPLQQEAGVECCHGRTLRCALQDVMKISYVGKCYRPSRIMKIYTRIIRTSQWLDYRGGGGGNIFYRDGVVGLCV